MKNENNEYKYLTPEEVAALLDAVDRDPNPMYRLRNQVIFRLAIYCGLRVSEIGMLERTSYDIKSRKLFIHRLKGSKNNTLKIIDTRFFPAIENYMDKYIANPAPFPDSNYLFCSRNGNPISRKQLGKLMYQYSKAAGISDPRKWHFHVLKHTCGITLIENGLDIKDVQFWLGHVCVESTMQYLTYTTRMQDALFEKIALKHQ